MPKLTFADGYVFEYPDDKVIHTDFQPYTVTDKSKSQLPYRKRPKGISMTDYYHNNSRTDYFVKYITSRHRHHHVEVIRDWFWERACGWDEDREPSELVQKILAQSVSRKGCIGAGGRGTQYLYAEAKCGYSHTRTPYYIGHPALVDLRSYNLKMRDSIEEAIAETQRTVVERTLQKYDALTEIAEGRETLRTIAGILSAIRSPAAAAKDLWKKISSSKTFSKTIAQYGLQYEYAIRPLLMSIEQIQKLMKNKDRLFIKQKATKLIVSESADVPTGIDGDYLYETGSRSIRVTSTSNMVYHSSFQKVTDLIQFNPIITAWELIPYSFVIDWFINVGDWLAMQMASYGSGPKGLYCTSVRERASVMMHYSRVENGCDPIDTTYEYKDWWDEKGNTCLTADSSRIPGSGWVYLKKSVFLPGFSGKRHDVVLSYHRADNYRRFTFEPSAVPIEINNPFDLSLRRTLDGLLLTLNALKR